MDQQQNLNESDPTKEDLLSFNQKLQDHIEQLKQQNRTQDELIEELEILLQAKDEQIKTKDEQIEELKKSI